ncbi:hypothetical protein [Sphingomonas alba]|uniref:DUF7847 domain-containing protein n=1 Tax=Sphingomonas alba TaxID=2908208 RepID=A0ABT0RJX6_9SPHN|nr:hypothetical protein [Sphingomonas alba]MCL6682922.1 hypothetical protein [Sphingomonas alba]
MGKLSLSKAWDETRDVLTRDGKLLGAVALALVFLPGVIAGVIDPKQTPATIVAGGMTSWLFLISALIGLVGQLAMIRLALGPATSVADAIAHGLRRMPVYLAGTMLWMLPLIILMGVFGRHLFDDPEAVSGTDALITVLVVCVLLFMTVRMILMSAVASAEHLGPVAMLKRAWALSSGNWWRLFAFVLMLGFAAIVLLGAVGAIAGIVGQLLFGEPEAMSVSALFIALFTELVSAMITTVFVVMVARLYAQGSGLSTVSVPSSGH